MVFPEYLIELLRGFLLQDQETKELQAKLEIAERRIAGLATRLNVIYPLLLSAFLGCCRIKAQDLRFGTGGS